MARVVSKTTKSPKVVGAKARATRKPTKAPAKATSKSVSRTTKTAVRSTATATLATAASTATRFERADTVLASAGAPLDMPPAFRQDAQTHRFLGGIRDYMVHYASDLRAGSATSASSFIQVTVTVIETTRKRIRGVPIGTFTNEVGGETKTLDAVVFEFRDDLPEGYDIKEIRRGKSRRRRTERIEGPIVITNIVPTAKYPAIMHVLQSADNPFIACHIKTAEEAMSVISVDLVSTDDFDDD